MMAGKIWWYQEPSYPSTKNNGLRNITMTDKKRHHELADFLRTRRARVTPEQAGEVFTAVRAAAAGGPGSVGRAVVPG